MKIFYIAGFGGQKNSYTFTNLLKEYSKIQFIEYDNENPNLAYKQIEEQLSNSISEKSLIIGQSLGGFWAEIFAIEKELDAILINPSFEPNISLKKYDINFNYLEDFTKYKKNNSIAKKISIFLSFKDTIVNSKPVIEKYTNKAKIIYIDENHQIKNLRPLFDEIELYINKR